ncbi:hypothetical protein HK098_004774 [Nowakowskiella sp. JEL0407]|nr:hypothetical protein HK098_004774 [Nowakowskiella sp. JEL0407]
MDAEDLTNVLSEQDTSQTNPSHYNQDSSMRSPRDRDDSYRGERRRSASPQYSSSRMRNPYERPPPPPPPHSSNYERDRYDRPSYHDNEYEKGNESSYSRGGGGGSGGGGYDGSKRDCRVYVGNLAYECGWADLKDFGRKCGDVMFADVLQGHNGRSKGCGIIEYRTPEDAQRAIKELSGALLMGRPVFLREDREYSVRPSGGPPFRSRYADRDRDRGYSGSSYRDSGSNYRPTEEIAGRQIFVGNLPYTVAWQDLKDTFRSAGRIIRADVNEDPHTRRSKGTGIVLFETVSEAQNAIAMFDNYEWHGRRLEVREDRFAGSSGRFSSQRYESHKPVYDSRPPPSQGQGYERIGDHHRAYDNYNGQDYGNGNNSGYGSSSNPPPPPNQPPPQDSQYSSSAYGNYGGYGNSGYSQPAQNSSSRGGYDNRYDYPQSGYQGPRQQEPARNDYRDYAPRPAGNEYPPPPQQYGSYADNGNGYDNYSR